MVKQEISCSDDNLFWGNLIVYPSLYKKRMIDGLYKKRIFLGNEWRKVSMIILDDLHSITTEVFLKRMTLLSCFSLL